MRALLLLALFSASAYGQDLSDRFNIRASISGEYLTEEQKGLSPAETIATPLRIGFAELRLTLDGRRLGDWDVKADGRIRVTGTFDPEADLSEGTTETTAQGYLGGREYQLYELYAHARWGKYELTLGRFLEQEADMLRVDGARFLVHVHPKWTFSIYGGGYSDPYSRSVNTDYVKGAPAFVGGLAARYNYEKIWGSFSGNVAWLGGPHDDGPVTFAPAANGGSLDFGTSAANANIRTYVTWTNFWRPIKWIDFYHDLVVDLWGATKTTLTRLDIYAAIHAGKHFTIRAGYDHMSALAIDTYLARLLNDRTQFQQGSIENNLTLSRTARDEGRLTLEGETGKTVFTADGRLRQRVLVTPNNDTQFVYQPGAGNDVGSQIAPRLGYDATLAIRNRGSLWGLRPGFWATYLNDYRARDIYVGVSVGRDFLDERLSVDLSFTYVNVHDDDAGLTCTTTGTLVSLPSALQTCYGTRKGNDFQPGITIGTSPTRHWYAFIDYRADVSTTVGIPAVITHVIVGRVEARY